MLTIFKWKLGADMGHLPTWTPSRLPLLVTLSHSINVINACRFKKLFKTFPWLDVFLVADTCSNHKQTAAATATVIAQTKSATVRTWINKQIGEAVDEVTAAMMDAWAFGNKMKPDPLADCTEWCMAAFLFPAPSLTTLYDDVLLGWQWSRFIGSHLRNGRFQGLWEIIFMWARSETRTHRTSPDLTPF